MGVLRKIIAIFILIFLISPAYAEDLSSINEGITIEEIELPATIDNSNMPVKVVKYSNNVEQILYQGLLGGYENGCLSSLDFSGIDFVVMFDWDSLDDGGVYIIPIDDDFEEELMVLPNENEVMVYQNSVVNTATENADIRISLLYNNSYSEAVLLPGEEFTAELEIVNSNAEDSIELYAMVALYDGDGRFIDVNIESLMVEANEIGEIKNTIIVPADSSVSCTKIMIWESINDLKPHTSPIVLTLSGDDFFGDDYTISQPLNKRNAASGMINTSEDTDVFSFVPQNDGLYYFETLSGIDTYASLYVADNLTTPIAADDNNGADNNFRLSATLEAGTTYYLYMNGRTEGQYTLNYGYSIGNVYGTVSPVKFYDDDTEFNSAIEATVELNTYYTGEFVATMHLKDWSVGDNEYASYSMTGVHSGDYLVKTERPGYLTYYQKISLIDNAIDLGSITLIPGDVNGDDVIDSADLNLVNSLIGTEYGSESYITSADINSDKVINAEDASLINANLNKNSNEYAGNVNVLFIDVETYDTQLIVTGNAAPNSTVNCVVFYEGYSIYEGETACSSDGLLEFIVDLNKSGNYTVLVTSDNQAYEVTKTITY